MFAKQGPWKDGILFIVAVSSDRIDFIVILSIDVNCDACSGNSTISWIHEYST